MYTYIHIYICIYVYMCKAMFNPNEKDSPPVVGCQTADIGMLQRVNMVQYLKPPGNSGKSRYVIFRGKPSCFAAIMFPTIFECHLSPWWDSPDFFK